MDYITNNIKLLHGDCLERMQEIEDNSVNLVLADPPYGSTLNDWDKIIPFDKLWQQYERVLHPSGCVILFGSQPFTSALVMSNPKWFKHELVWDKNKCGSPGLAKIRPMKTHENIAVFSQMDDEEFYEVHDNLLIFAPGRTTYNPQMEAGEPYSRKSSNPAGYVGRCNNHKYGMKPKTEFTNEGTRYPKSILRISRDFSAQQQVHPTQKPVSLMEWLVLTYSNEWDTVLDNVFGSCPVGIACMNSNRKFIGIEKDEEYFDIGLKRILDNTHSS